MEQRFQIGSGLHYLLLFSTGLTIFFLLYLPFCLKIIKLYFLNIKKKLNIRFDENLNHKNIRFLICEIL
ncbi:hypothetical protein ACT54M_15720 [Leptospira santarosai]|uniref:Uncharacterized protein n=1 Tax=Leptospira santarosai TaxID=28183 RepID=A0AB73N900_9LEPT|nr:MULTISPECIES: hypothetical protein [Leptospira]EKO78723.1 hypothetical protein LEP1GSC068_2620 [Leptospira sp. Fiocruz LV3954]EMI69624.1 hypothetical protein LEP1GSC076_2902 [Leptospira sp. Fiocruz LV4135]OLY62198.1 hypothetical protein BV917_01200 [Leptospira santarosai serovar Guaricura]ONF93231.1 hypothetical protein BWD14_08750 [Leptospira santarosai]